MDKLARVLAHPLVALTKLRRSGSRLAFTHRQRRLGGLHRLLDRSHPFEAHRADECVECARAATATQRRRAAGVRERDYRKTRRSTLVRVRAHTRCSASDDCAHGIDVDRQIDAFVRTRAAPSEQCARAIVARLEADGWRLVASQVPLFARSQRFASAIDLLCVRGARLALVEVKASLHRERTRCYTASPRLERDVEQTRRLARALADDVGVDVDEALLVRAAEGKVTVFSVK